MPISEALFGSLLVVTLIGFGVWLASRQGRRLRQLKQLALPEDEMRWERQKAWRRLISAGLLGLIAVLLVGQLLWWEPASQQLLDEREELHPEQRPPFTSEQKELLHLWGGTWLAILLLLLAVVILAGIDLWATRLYGLREYRKLQADRRAMIQRQTNRLRQERNGHN